MPTNVRQTADFVRRVGELVAGRKAVSAETCVPCRLPRRFTGRFPISGRHLHARVDIRAHGQFHLHLLEIERGILDTMDEYAQASLLHYARWMAQHEYPYLEKPERLEFSTETWAARDIRKADVFLAAQHHRRPSAMV